ncbi:hypothetical protein GCM10018980_72340 [Streptomyces capoamus]|uniref:Tn3 transposase DDE domain-containing protein n=1 Tax=Streptomyces capoamus TaxID=68183 RepID=A0A919F340_9ACTN|nr:hypothetical protein GCM10010501_16980 [Streptomyces libani subsp. rufus]GHG75059.1 hypothetical protein GCM10018980_72340 [Streptomyces capoamus]
MTKGHDLQEEDIARLSPLEHRNLNLLGRYSFTASTPDAGALRPLRDPDTQKLDEDDDGGGLDQFPTAPARPRPVPILRSGPVSVRQPARVVRLPGT